MTSGHTDCVWEKTPNCWSAAYAGHCGAKKIGPIVLTHQGEGLLRGQTVDGDLLEAGDDAGTGQGFTLSHPQNPLIGQRQVTGHAHHHLAQLGHKEKTDTGEDTRQ